MEFTTPFTKISPGCGCADFAVPTPTYKSWRNHGTIWHCPNCGRSRRYAGLTNDQKKIRKLERDRDRAISAASEARITARKREQQYDRIAKRVSAGVCPCCNRTFQNFAEHMKTEHPDFSEDQKLRHKRQMLGLTQADLAEELGIAVGYVSKFENTHPVPEWASESLEEWVIS